MVFSNSALIQYGNCPLIPTDILYTFPTLTSNGTLGQGDFSCTSSSVWEGNDKYQPYRAFNKSYNRSNGEFTSSGNYPYITIYNSRPLKIKSITITGDNNDYYARAIEVLGSNINGDFTSISNYTPVTPTNTYTAQINSNNYYNYHKFIFTAKNSFQINIIELDIEAYYKTEALNNFTFPTSFSCTNYSLAIGQYTNSLNSNTVLQNKTTTGISVNTNALSGDILMYNAVGF